MRYAISVIHVYITDYCLGSSKKTSGLRVSFGHTLPCILQKYSLAGMCTTAGQFINELCPISNEYQSTGKFFLSCRTEPTEYFMKFTFLLTLNDGQPTITTEATDKVNNGTCRD